MIHDDNGTMKARQGVFGGYKTVRRKGLCVPKHLSYKKMEGYQCCCAAVVGWVGEGGKKFHHHHREARPDWPSLVVCITTYTHKRFILSLSRRMFAVPDVLVRQKKKTMHHQRTIITRPFRKRSPPPLLQFLPAIIIYTSV